MNNQFIWRPNDNSDRTRLRYSLEAEHWLDAFENAQNRRKHVSIRETTSVLGLILSFVINVVILIVIGIVRLIKWARS